VLSSQPSTSTARGRKQRAEPRGAAVQPADQRAHSRIRSPPPIAIDCLARLNEPPDSAGFATPTYGDDHRASRDMRALPARRTRVSESIRCRFP